VSITVFEPRRKIGDVPEESVPATTISDDALIAAHGDVAEVPSTVKAPLLGIFRVIVQVLVLHVRLPGYSTLSPPGETDAS
jgi:hypothetical protein